MNGPRRSSSRRRAVVEERGRDHVESPRLELCDRQIGTRPVEDDEVVARLHVTQRIQERQGMLKRAPGGPEIGRDDAYPHTLASGTAMASVPTHGTQLDDASHPVTHSPSLCCSCVSTAQLNARNCNTALKLLRF